MVSISAKGNIGRMDYHGGDLVEGLQDLYDLGLVRGLHPGEAARLHHRLPLLGGREVVKLAAGVGHGGHVVVLPEDAHASADGHGGSCWECAMGVN